MYLKNNVLDVLENDENNKYYAHDINLNRNK